MAKDLEIGTDNKAWVPFPVLGLASDGADVFMTSGGGGASSVKEVPNRIHALRYCEATHKLQTIAELNTGTNLVVNLTYSPVTNIWLASTRKGCKLLSLSGSNISEICEFESESEGKGPEQNFALYSPDASLIVTGGTDGIVKVWNAGAHGSMPTLQRACSKGKEVLDAAFSSDGRYLATCDGSGDCKLLDLQKNPPDEGSTIVYQSKAVHGKALVKLVRFVTHKGQMTLLLAGNGIQRKMNFGALGLHTLQGQLLCEIVADQGPLKSIAVRADEQMAVVGLMSGKKVVISLNPGLKSMTKTKELHSLPCQCVGWTGQSTALSVSGDRDVHILRVGGSGSGTSLGLLIQVFFLLMLVIYQMYRIGVVGALNGQGTTYA